MRQESQQRIQTQEHVKLPYEKPRLDQVNLIADQVLQVCGQDRNTCSQSLQSGS
jgi:hypothetical protein